MAHFAKITEDNQVLSVIYINDSDIQNADGIEDETVGQAYLQKHNNWPSHLWIKTSYNTRLNKYYREELVGTHEGKEYYGRVVASDQSKSFRGNYAGIGFIWDEENNIFLSEKPYPSWVKDLTNAHWKSPIGDSPIINEEQDSQNVAGTHRWTYVWNESTTTWDLTNIA